MNLDTLTAWVTIFGVIGGTLSVVIALVGVKREREWNRPVNAEEILTKLVDEEFRERLAKIEEDFGW